MIQRIAHSSHTEFFSVEGYYTRLGYVPVIQANVPARAMFIYIYRQSPLYNHISGLFGTCTYLGKALLGLFWYVQTDLGLFSGTCTYHLQTGSVLLIRGGISANTCEQTSEQT